MKVLSDLRTIKGRRRGSVLEYLTIRSIVTTNGLGEASVERMVAGEGVVNSMGASVLTNVASVSELSFSAGVGTFSAALVDRLGITLPCRGTIGSAIVSLAQPGLATTLRSRSWDAKPQTQLASMLARL